MAIPGRVYRARGKGLGIGDRCSIGQCPPQPDPVGLGVRGLEAQGRGCPGFFIYFYFLLFVSLPSCSSACIRRTDFPSQELSRLFSFTRGLRDGGEHRKHWGGSQDAPMASPFTLTPLKWSLDIKTVWFWANITKKYLLAVGLAVRRVVCRLLSVFHRGNQLVTPHPAPSPTACLGGSF